MQKVCHVTSAHKRFDDRIFYKECVYLAKEGYDVTLLVNDNLENEKKDGVKIISTGRICGSRRERVKIVREDLVNKALEIDAQLYHLHDPELLLIAKRLKKNKKTVIFDSHEYYYEQIQNKEYIPTFLRKIISKIYFIFENSILKKIDGLIYPCNTIDENGCEENIFSGRCKNTEIIANHPTRIVNKEGKKARKKSEDFKVCYTGGLSEDRGILQLMDACYLAGVKLILAGSFSSLTFEDRVLSRESFSCVDYRGICTMDEVYDIYRESDAGAQLLRNKGQYYKIATFGVKVYEYMQMELPVIIYSSPFTRLSIEKNKFGVTVDVENVEEIAEKICWLKNNRNEAKKMGKNGKELCNKYYTWEVELKKLTQLYQKILDGMN